MTADPGECSFQFNPIGTAKFTSSCDIAKRCLARKLGAATRTSAAPAGTVAQVKIGDKVIDSLRHGARPVADADGPGRRRFNKAVDRGASRAAGYPAKADPAKINKPMTWSLILTMLVIYVTMVYGPIAAMLVEMFPTRIRYTDVPAVPHRQRLVRRLPADDRLRHRGGDRQHVQRPVVPDRDRGDDLRDRRCSSCRETKDVDIYAND